MCHKSCCTLRICSDKTANSCCWGILVEQKLQRCVWWFDTTITSLLWASRKVFLSAFLVQTGLMTMWPLKEAVQTLETVNKYGRIRQGCRPAFVWQRVGEHPGWWRGIKKIWSTKILKFSDLDWARRGRRQKWHQQSGRCTLKGTLKTSQPRFSHWTIERVVAR